jgi:hypothetical protein
MVPAQLVADAVAVLADAGAKAFDFGDERIPIELGKIFVHAVLLMAVMDRDLLSSPVPPASHELMSHVPP